MSPKNLWAMILGISDDDWERMRDSFQQIPDSVINIRKRFEDIGQKVLGFIENNRSKIEKVLVNLINYHFNSRSSLQQFPFCSYFLPHAQWIPMDG